MHQQYQEIGAVAVKIVGIYRFWIAMNSINNYNTVVASYMLHTYPNPDSHTFLTQST